ncbi:MAG: beta-ketoacyl synthase N-terminal-like domain-containing protein, partial [Pelovirga sp.]
MAYAQSVAVVAMGGEFPDAANLGDYWDLILKKRNCARRPPTGRWLLPVEEAYDPEIGVADRVYSDKACFLADTADSSEIQGLDIDAEFLRQLDPMFRLLLRVGQQTMTHAGTPSFDPTRAGVIIGNLALPSESSSALARQLLGKIFVEKLTDQPLTVDQSPIVPQNHYVAGLPAAVLARGLGFGGTCFTLDAACASSLYAIKLAVDELLSGRADLMLAGGLSRPDSLYTQMGFSQLRALSANGRCAPFDRSGNGLVVGEGCGLLLLKRTRDAQRDGDRILAVIRGIGLSNDLQGNLLAPSSEGQLRAMRAAYRQAGWQPTDVDLIECHATGTPVGDAVEFSSLQHLWGNSGWRSGQCVIGSVKANIGHLLTAAGAAATIKTILALSHRMLPPQTHFERPAAGVDLDKSPFRLLGQACPWHQRREEVPRRAAVSAFGFGGINAHMLLEEWQPERANRKKVTLHPSVTTRQTPIAVVGLAAHYGPWSDLQALRQRLFGVDAKVEPEIPSHWWGGSESRWLQQIFPQGLPQGFCLGPIGAAAGDFRIPPTEMAEMLPRQLLMLKVAAAALENAHADHDDHLFTGVFIGCGLDHNATNFSFRWGLAQQARIWAKELGLELTEDELAGWITELREAAGPALTANRTMGALGSVVASRIAREFGVGGPSFTISSEENSSLRALEVAIHALQEGSIKRALVGAVDLAADLRDVVCRQSLTPFGGVGQSRPLDRESQGIQLGEGAGALVLKRLEDARQDGDQIHAVISGVGTTIGGEVDQLWPVADVLRKAVIQACSSAGVKPADIGYLEIDGSGDPEADALEAVTLSETFTGDSRKTACWLGSVKADIGHAGGAAGMAGVIKAILCLKQRLLPPVRRLTALRSEWKTTLPLFQVADAPQYWLTNRVAGVRRAMVTSLGNDGSCSALIVEEHQGNLPAPGVARPLGDLTAGLFALNADSLADMGERLTELKQLVAQYSDECCDQLARRWYRKHPSPAEASLCLALVLETPAELNAQLDQVTRQLERLAADDSLKFTDLLSPAQRERVFFSGEPLAPQGKIAFIFPGSGNHFAGMGRELAVRWPEVYAAQESANSRLADQYQPQHFWNGALSDALLKDHNALVISHVALCTALHDLLSRFAIRPQMVSGYSLGESSGLFSTGAWSERDAMLQRLKDSPLFTRELAGECRAARRTWGLPPGRQVDWCLGIVNVAADQVKKVLDGKKQVYLLIINTYKECVIGGQRRQVDLAVKELGCHFIPLQGVTTVHCEVTRAVADAYRNLHLFDVRAPRGVDFYSCAFGGKYPLTTTNAADAILAQALDTIDYPRVIERLYADGARIFLEVGPGSSCTRMITSILGERPHMARSFCVAGQDAAVQFLRLLGHCLAEGVNLELSPLYSDDKLDLHVSAGQRPQILTTTGGSAFTPALPLNNDPTPRVDRPPAAAATSDAPALSPAPEPPVGLQPVNHENSVLEQLTAGFRDVHAAGGAAHAAFLELSADLERSLAEQIEYQQHLLQQADGKLFDLDQSFISATHHIDQCSMPVVQGVAVEEQGGKGIAPVFDRHQCMEFAVGSVARMLGKDFAEVDTFPTRVRLPDEPLMLVDRIIALEGEPRSMT